MLREKKKNKGWRMDKADKDWSVESSVAAGIVDLGMARDCSARRAKWLPGGWPVCG